MNQDDSTVAVALAQYSSVPTDVVANVTKHVEVVREAAAAGARVVVFPELSLTGYELARIADDPHLRLTLNDPRLAPLLAATATHSVLALVGAPLQDGAERRLACLAIHPDGTVRSYAKRNLFQDERRIFKAGSGPLVLDVGGTRLAVGVCADLADDLQVDELSQLDADAWLLGVLLTPAGYDDDAGRAARAAGRTGATVLLANHAAPTGGWIPAGRSGTWESGGGGRRLSWDGSAAKEELVIVDIPRRKRRRPAATARRDTCSSR
jgi:predicted amidohydrolase